MEEQFLGLLLNIIYGRDEIMFWQKQVISCERSHVIPCITPIVLIQSQKSQL